MTATEILRDTRSSSAVARQDRWQRCTARDSDVGNLLFERRIQPDERLAVTDVAAVDIMAVLPQSSETAVSIPNHIARRISVHDGSLETPRDLEETKI